MGKTGMVIPRPQCSTPRRSLGVQKPDLVGDGANVLESLGVGDV